MTDARTPARPVPTGPLPALYLGHGAPPLLEDETWMGELRAWARRAAAADGDPHRQRALADRADGDQRHRRACPLVYDFYGFPEHYYRMTYDAPGAPELAAKVRGADAVERAGPGTADSRPGPRRVGAAQGDVSRRGHPGPPALDAGPRPAAPLRGRSAPRAAARRGRAHRRQRVPDPRPAVHRRVLHGQARRAAVVDRLRPVGRARRSTEATSTRCSTFRSEGARACRTRTRRWSISRRCS